MRAADACKILFMTLSHPCFVFAAGTYYGNEPTAEKMPTNAFVITADGGLDHAIASGIRPDLAIGDFDSAKAGIPQGVETIALPPEHDDPDMLSALKAGWSRGYRDFRIYGGLGGRIDHSVANIQMLALLAHNGGIGLLYGEHSVVTAICNGSIHFSADALSLDSNAADAMGQTHRDIRNIPGYEAKTGSETCKNPSSPRSHPDTRTASETMAKIDSETCGNPGDGADTDPANRMVSVFSHADISRGVTETGLKYELENGTMRSDTVLGVSNELLDGCPASISVADGTLIITFPMGTTIDGFTTTVAPIEDLGPLADQPSKLLARSAGKRD